MRRLVLPALLAALAASASAQPVWRPTPAGPAVSLDVLRPFSTYRISIGVESEARPLHSTQVVTARVPIRGVWTAVVDVPTAHYDVATSSYDFSQPTPPPNVTVVSEFGVGNPYVGAEAAVRADVAVEAGVRLPLSRANELEHGTLAGTVGRSSLRETPEAFQPGAFSASAGVRYETAVRPWLRLRLRAALALIEYPTFVLAPGRLVPVRETDLGVHYGAQAVGLIGPFEVVVGAAGRRDGSAGLPDPAVMLLGASVGGLPVRTGVHVRVPWRNDRFFESGDVGLSLDVPLR